MGADHPRHLGRVGVHHRPAPAGDAGVAHDDVEVAHGLDGLGHQPPALLEVVDRGADGHGPAAQPSIAATTSAAASPPAVVDDDVGAVLGQTEGDGPADPPAAAGHEGHPTCQFHAGAIRVAAHAERPDPSRADTERRQPSRRQPAGAVGAEVGHDREVVGGGHALHRLGRPPASTAATDPSGLGAGPGHQHVVEAPLGPGGVGEVGVAAVPRVAGPAVAGHRPGVGEDQAGHRRRRGAGEQPHLVGVGDRVEVAGEDGREAARRGPAAARPPVRRSARTCATRSAEASKGQSRWVVRT